MDKVNLINMRLNHFALEAMHKQAKLVKDIGRAADVLSTGTEVAAKLAKHKLHQAERTVLRARRNARRGLDETFQPGQGRNLIEKTRSAIARANERLKEAKDRRMMIGGNIDDTLTSNAPTIPVTGAAYKQPQQQTGASFSSGTVGLQEDDLLGSDFGSLSLGTGKAGLNYPATTISSQSGLLDEPIQSGLQEPITPMVTTFGKGTIEIPTRKPQQPSQQTSDSQAF